MVLAYHNQAKNYISIWENFHPHESKQYGLNYFICVLALNAALNTASCTKLHTWEWHLAANTKLLMNSITPEMHWGMLHEMENLKLSSSNLCGELVFPFKKIPPPCKCPQTYLLIQCSCSSF